jgi:hypothetical protein
MKTTITALLLCGAISSSAQCNYEQNEVDSYTNAHKVTSRAKIALSMGTGAWFDFRIVNDAALLTIRITGSVGGSVVGEDDALMIKLANDSVVTFRSRGLYTSEYQAANVWHITATYPATLDQFRAIAASTVNGFRMYTVTEYLEYSLADKPKWQGRVKEAVECLLAVAH